MLYRAYMDESGDPGYPQRSSELFILTNVYMKDKDWESNYKTTRWFREKLAQEYGFPIVVELHTNQLLQNKKPYCYFDWSDSERVEIVESFFDLILELDVKIINVCINKIYADENGYDDEDKFGRRYDVLGRVMKYSVQRLDNDITEDDHYIIITDEGRAGQMARVASKMRDKNLVPSKIGHGYRNGMELEDRLVEDPRGRSSDSSEFIQIADAVSLMVLLYMRKNISDSLEPLENRGIFEVMNNLSWSNRIKDKLDPDDPERLLDKIRDKINLRAKRNSPLGVVHYPEIRG